MKTGSVVTGVSGVESFPAYTTATQETVSQKHRNPHRLSTTIL